MEANPFKELLESTIRGSFFVRGHLEKFMVDNQIDIVVQAMNTELNNIYKKHGVAFSPIFRFEVIPGHRRLTDIRMLICREEQAGKTLDVMGHLDFKHVLSGYGDRSKQHSMLLYDVTRS